MQRHLWTDSVSKTFCPAWTCPVCRIGKTVLRHGSLQFEETTESKKEHRQDYWGPEYIELHFIAWADCNNSSCKQCFALAGRGGIEQSFDHRTDETSWEEAFTPSHVTPAPQIIDLPSATPREIHSLFALAFALYWPDPEACAGKVRSAIEALLTYLGIPELDRTDHAKPKRLSLHLRLEQLEKIHAEPSKLLMGIKWMGNAGSHGGTVSRRDVLDSFEILEHILPELLEGRSERMKELAARLTKRHRQ